MEIESLFDLCSVSKDMSVSAGKSVPYSGISPLTYSHYRIRTQDSIKSIIDYCPYQEVWVGI